jgi:hypothetical protein
MTKANRNQSSSQRAKRTASRFRFGAYASSLLLVGGLLLAACTGGGGGGSSGGSTSGGSLNTCPTGFCLSAGACCPISAKFNCNGNCVTGTTAQCSTVKSIC